MTTALFYGDSITDARYELPNGAFLPSGFYADLVCRQMGYTRVGQTDDNARAGFAGTTLDAHYGIKGAFDLTPFGGNAAFACRFAAYAPDVAVVLYGVNDYWFMGGAATLDTWAAAWQAFYALVDALPVRPRLYICGLPPGTQPPMGGLPWWAYSIEWLRREMDAVTQTVARAHFARFVPLDTALTTADLRDGTHPDARGHCRIAGQIVAAMGAT